jgi:hypothetical protein
MKRLISIALGACLLPGATAQAAEKTVGQSSTTSEAARYNGSVPILAGH